jgi:hypothetical protein
VSVETIAVGIRQLLIQVPNGRRSNGLRWSLGSVSTDCSGSLSWRVILPRAAPTPGLRRH